MVVSFMIAFLPGVDHGAHISDVEFGGQSQSNAPLRSLLGPLVRTVSTAAFVSQRSKTLMRPTSSRSQPACRWCGEQSGRPLNSV